MALITLLKSSMQGRGGLEKHTRRLAQAFVEAGHHTTLLTGPLPSDFHVNGMEVISLGRSSPFSFQQIQQFDKCCQEWLKSHRSDVVFGLDRNSFQTHYRAGNGVHAAYLATRSQTNSWIKRLSFGFNPLHQTILRMERLTFENSGLQTLFTNSEMVRDQILAHYKTPVEKIHVVHNGVEWLEYAPDFAQWPQVRHERAVERGLDPSKFQLLFVGHGYRRKGLGVLLQGLADLNCKGLQLSVIGADREIVYFRKEAARLAIADQVLFFGPRSDMRAFYQIADALIIPSYYDPFANVTLEALAMGLYVVSSKHNGGHEIIKSGCGTVIGDLGDRSAVAAALMKMLCHRKTVANSKAIRQSVEHLDFSRQLARIIDLTVPHVTHATEG